MASHFSSVNFLNLIRDLAEMYPYEVPEVVLTELVANSLDAKATVISIDVDKDSNKLVVCDNGKGMGKTQFAEYHDFAAGLKTRGSGIGFAGVGAKISFNVADRVITETKSNSFCGGSDWHYDSKGKLVWRDLDPQRIKGHGTRVEVHFKRGHMGQLLTEDAVPQLLRRHYLPLLDESFLKLYRDLGIYSNLSFLVQGKPVPVIEFRREYQLSHVTEFFPRIAGKRIGYGVFGLADRDYPVGEDMSGVLLCTHGKVIKQEFFGQFPGKFGSRIVGLVEIKEFIRFLTTAKNDFVRAKGKYRQFVALFEPLRLEFVQWLAGLGVETSEPTSDQEAEKLERELGRLVSEIPELNEFFGFRSRTKLQVPSANGESLGKQETGAENTFPDGKGAASARSGVMDVGADPGIAFLVDQSQGTIPVTPVSRVAKRGPKITFLDAADRIELAWVQGNGIVINVGHPSYKRIRASATAKHLHHIYAIAVAIQRFTGESGDNTDLDFIDRMLTAWARN